MWSISQVMEFSIKVSLVVVVGHFVIEATHLGKLHRFVECDLCLCGTKVERRIPCSPVWTIEAAAKRIGMRESMLEKGSPNTSSCAPIPGSSWFSARRRSFVALSKSKMSGRWLFSSAIRAKTLLPPMLYLEGMSR
jgi:hypothetical protein